MANQWYVFRSKPREETFGLPLLEAMEINCPVVTSNISSMPEITGSAAVLIDSCRTKSISEGLYEVLANPERREQMIEAGQAQAQLFTYEWFFDQLMKVLEETGEAGDQNSRWHGGGNEDVNNG